MIEVTEEQISHRNDIIRVYLENENECNTLTSPPLARLLAYNYIKVLGPTSLRMLLRVHLNLLAQLDLDRPYLTYSYILTILSLIPLFVNHGIMRALEAKAFLLLKCNYVGNIEEQVEKEYIRIMTRLQ